MKKFGGERKINTNSKLIPSLALFVILLGSVLTNAIPVFAETTGYSTPSSDQFQSLKDQFYVAQGRLNSVFESIFGSLTGIIAQQNAPLQNNNSHTSESSLPTSTQTVSYNNNDVTSQTTNDIHMTTDQTESNTQNQTESNTQNQNDIGSEIYVNGTSHDGSVVVHIASRTPTANQSLPMVIYFTDPNGTAIDEMHYSITADQNGNQVLSLPHVFLNKGMTQHNTSPLSTNDPVNVQVTILGIGLAYDHQHWTGPIGDVISLQIGTPQPSLSVATDQPSYHHGDTATISAALRGYGQGENVAITVSNPSGDVIVSRTVLTGDNGIAQTQFKIPDRYADGTYEVVATVNAGGMIYKDNTQFSIESNPAHFTIVSVQATDQNGNPVSSFSKGTTGFAKITVSADSNQTALITADLFDSNSVSLGIGSVKTNLGAGESQMIVSFYVPKDAVVGTANIFANAFSDWPSNNGTPLTEEVSSSVEIQ